MSKKLAFCFAIAVFLVPLTSAVANAQLDIVAPDAGVRGSGAIALSNTHSVGLFDISVAQYGSMLYGGFRFTEVDSSGVRQHVVVAKYVKSLEFKASNHAVIRAVGYWNNWEAEITLEALDGLAGDWLSIVAVPRNSVLDVIYHRAGGVIKGDIVVFRKAEVKAFAKGRGAIPVGHNIGHFDFYAQATSAGVDGKLYYAVLNPMISSILPRPCVQVHVPKVVWLKVVGNRAEFGGPGAINGQRAKVTVIALDNSMVLTPLPVPDYFEIHAVTESGREYSASGKLIRGDIVVGSATRE